jgi:hypothetical protein
MLGRARADSFGAMETRQGNLSRTTRSTASRRNRLPLLHEVNGASVSAKQLRRYMDACRSKRRINDPDYNLRMQITTASRQANDDPVLALALFHRARALSLLATERHGLPRWAVDEGDALFQAAAVEGMSHNVEGEIVFDREQFLRRVFVFIQPEVWVQ